MAKVFFYCDESGAKGYADQKEDYPGEIGVFAGILVPEECLATVQPVFNQIAKQYMRNSGKLHISDLPKDHQEEVRNEIFAAIKKFGLPCFWYAIHVAGLHAYYVNTSALFKQIKDNVISARDEAAPRIKRGSPRENPLSMHIELFTGLYSRLVAFLSEQGQQGVDVMIMTDHVDTPIVEQFTIVAKELLDNDPCISTFTGFDTVEKKVVTGSITNNVKWPPELDFSPVVSSLSITTTTMPDSDGLTLAADVLANSLLYLFRNRHPDSLYGPLNCREAVASHPLFDRLDTFENWGAGDCVGDGIYKHPKTHPRVTHNPKLSDHT